MTGVWSLILLVKIHFSFYYIRLVKELNFGFFADGREFMLVPSHFYLLHGNLPSPLVLSTSILVFPMDVKSQVFGVWGKNSWEICLSWASILDLDRLLMIPLRNYLKSEVLMRVWLDPWLVKHPPAHGAFQLNTFQNAGAAKHVLASAKFYGFLPYRSCKWGILIPSNF